MNEFHFPTNHSRRRAGQPDPRTAYVEEFTNRLTAMLRRRYRRLDIDDIVGREVLALWQQIDRRMATFPNPGIYAHVRATADRALIGHQRTEQSQRGEGARGGRTVVSIDDTPSGHAGPTTNDGHRGHEPLDEHSNIEAFLHQSDIDQRLRAALLGLSVRERQVLMLIDGHGYTVTEVARTLGVARETVSRLRSAVYRRLDLQPPC